MSFNGKEGNPIPLGQAVKWVHAYQRINPNLPKAYFFGRDILERLLKEEGCMGIRIYMGEDDKGELHPVLVGCRADQSNILPKSMTTAGEEEEPIVVNDSAKCPPECAPPGDPFAV
jgi:hypothetical protein